MALVEGVMSPSEVARAARIETVFQVERFGEVEWAHTIEEHDTVARLAASALFARAKW